MEIAEFKAVIGIWLLAQAFIAPWIFIGEYRKEGLAVENVKSLSNRKSTP